MIKIECPRHENISGLLSEMCDGFHFVLFFRLSLVRYFLIKEGF